MGQAGHASRGWVEGFWGYGGVMIVVSRDSLTRLAKKEGRKDDSAFLLGRSTTPAATTTTTFSRKHTQYRISEQLLYWQGKLTRKIGRREKGTGSGSFERGYTHIILFIVLFRIALYVCRCRPALMGFSYFSYHNLFSVFLY